MTQQDTNQLKSEISAMIKSGKTFLNCTWLDSLTDSAKLTLSEYHYDAKELSKRDIAIMLHNNQDQKIWDIILA